MTFQQDHYTRAVGRAITSSQGVYGSITQASNWCLWRGNLYSSFTIVAHDDHYSGVILQL